MVKKEKGKKPEKVNAANEIMSWIIAIVSAVVLAYFIKAFIFNTTVVEGSSMYPTLTNGDRLISVRISLYFKSPQKGDIAIFESPVEEGKDYIKRVIATEGDEIRLENGAFFVNGERLTENYLEEDSYTLPGRDNIKSWTIKDGELFMVGDNRTPGGSYDSREFGPIEEERVRGIAVFRYYPLNKIQKLD